MSDHPELDGYEPTSDKPLRGPIFTWSMRVVVILALAGLLLPGIVSTVNVATAATTSAADDSCRLYAALYSSSAVGFDARFEPLGPAGPGWYCYTYDFRGDESLLRALGLFPELPSIPAVDPLEEKDA